MTPPKAEHPDQGCGYSSYDRPVGTPDMVGSAATQHVLRAEVFDIPVAGTEHLWDDENSFLASLQAQVSDTKQRRSA